MGALLRGAAARSHGRRARNRARAAPVGQRDRESVDLPSESVHAPPPRLPPCREQPRPRVLPRPARDAGDARVRCLLRSDARTSRRDRPHPGDEPGDGGARVVDGDRAGEGAPHPDRDRRRRVRPTRRCRPARSTGKSRPADLGVRRRLVPEGRRRLGRRDGAQADQGPRRPTRRLGASCRSGARAVRPPHRSRTRVRQVGSRPARHPVPSSAPTGRGRGCARVLGDRRLASSPRATRVGRGPCSSRWPRGSRS